MVSETGEFYVYHLIDPRDDSVFYIGKGKGDRVKDHAKGVRAGRMEGNGAKIARIRAIHAAGLDVVERIAHAGQSEIEAFRLEREEIAAHSGENLTNIKHGVVTSAEARRQKSVAMLSMVKPYDDWVKDADVDAIKRVFGEPEDFYQMFVESIKKEIDEPFPVRLERMFGGEK